MDRKTHLIVESIQEMTLYAWPTMYGEDNPFDLPGSEVLETIRGWGEEFENMWQSHDEEYYTSHDYLEELWAFTDKKLEEFLKLYKYQVKYQVSPRSYDAAGWDLRHGEYEGDQECSYN